MRFVILLKWEQIQEIKEGPPELGHDPENPIYDVMAK